MKLYPHLPTSSGELQSLQHITPPNTIPFELRARAGDDLFSEPGSAKRVESTTLWGSKVADPAFQFSVYAWPDFKADFDSAAIVLWASQDRWCKICAEIDPGGQRRVVTVVTHGRSDDANGPLIGDEGVFLRASRNEKVIALHYSTDGSNWDLVRLFEMPIGPAEPLFVGITVQSPSGDGTTAVFDHVRFTSEPLADPRASS